MWWLVGEIVGERYGRVGVWFVFLLFSIFLGVFMFVFCLRGGVDGFGIWSWCVG